MGLGFMSFGFINKLQVKRKQFFSYLFVFLTYFWRWHHFFRSEPLKYNPSRLFKKKFTKID